ncbi:MAG TPA: adenylate/guanylate cyclase domain-containing protein [Oligoflexia bacterium]|nr:adenylate/guanylate cyclase domain-containing protein [Oligoflexia bacterium]
MLKTKNLVILFTDIAGYTEYTSNRSRIQNQQMVDKHNSILLPVIRRFKGRHVKSIGDALLLTFTSPTDAMRCAMAMQDALHEHNLGVPEADQIHIRIAASLGEVRTTRNDVFGEAVNLTSRIETITPSDEIYFSEAVYLAMNKAEVPAVEIGMQELKGIPKPVKIFAIPRFADSKLVSEPHSSIETDPRIAFPYGGMHLNQGFSNTNWIKGVISSDISKNYPKISRNILISLAIGVVLILLVGNYDFFLKPHNLVIKEQISQNSNNPFNPLKQTPPASELSSSKISSQRGRLDGLIKDLAEQNNITKSTSSGDSSESENAVIGNTNWIVVDPMMDIKGPLLPPPMEVLPENDNKPNLTTGLSSTDPIVKSNPQSSVVIETTGNTKSKKNTFAATSKLSEKINSDTESRKPSNVFRNISQVKAAYKANKITKDTYKQQVNRIESEYERKVQEEKYAYRSNRISKDQYKSRVRALKREYYGDR